RSSDLKLGLHGDVTSARLVPTVHRMVGADDVLPKLSCYHERRFDLKSDEAVAQRACMPLPHEEVEQALILFTELFGLLGEGCPGGVHYAQVRPHEVHKPDVALVQHWDLGVKQRLPVQALSLPPSGCVMYILAH